MKIAIVSIVTRFHDITEQSEGDTEEEKIQIQKEAEESWILDNLCMNVDESSKDSVSSTAIKLSHE